MTKPIRIQRKRTKYDGERIRRWLASPDRPRADCHPERPHQGRGLCKRCYDRWLYANSETRNANIKKKNNEWRERNREKVRIGQREQKLKLKYGLTAAKFEEMLRQQGGKCPLCQRSDLALVVDHCHDSGRVRGLLCAPCNSSLGWVEQLLLAKRTEWMRGALKYLGHPDAS